MVKLLILNANNDGTTADWTMVIVTSITAVLLYFTLKSQKDVQRQQQTLTAMELDRYRVEIMPIFKVEIDEHNFRHLQNAGLLEISLPVVIKSASNNVAKNVTIKVSSTDANWHLDAEKTYNFNEVLPSFCCDPSFKYQGEHIPEVNQPVNTELHFSIIFSDRLGNKYSQEATYFSMKNPAIETYYPKLVNERQEIMMPPGIM